ncbi:CBS domain-containing protein [Actinokineospora sp. HBU206404]|uniref:CBS domain-containing protein n=1 Tax=Actinokineospora xionganensis TaxID=2684470 RepID=A0ABR7KZU1_9PSEU|nr:CBS domain-containing protein [Actinokineospora xionganensis]
MAAVMTQPVAAVCPGTPYIRVIAAMTAHGSSVLPLVDITGRLLGAVSEVRSEVRSEVEPGPKRWFARLASKTRNRRATALSSLDLATATAPTVHADHPLADALRKLAEPGVRRLFVVDSRGTLVGVVCRSDV